MFRTGYITTFRGDLVWFLGLPFIAMAAALASQYWLSAVALASCALWINVPHTFSTILRVYGLEEDRQRFGDRLIVGLIAICGLIYFGIVWFPISLVLLITLWNHQHFMMQLHGFTRIYDFKARAGLPTTGGFDLGLNIVLYFNMFLTAPLFTKYWVRELVRFGVPLTISAVDTIQILSLIATSVYGLVYLRHVFACVRAGVHLNPVKYLFLATNYSVLYYLAFRTDSLLVHGIANMIMHGLQYFVIIYLFTEHKVQQSPGKNRFLSTITGLGAAGPIAFFTLCVLYAVIYQLVLNRPLEEFGFGVLSFMNQYGEALPPMGLAALSEKEGLDLYLSVIIAAPGLLHLYYDSFIWKVRESKSQAGLSS